MECSIYHCNSCGAELFIDQAESASYCAYCGQPTVVFQRVDKQKRPKYIIPFRVTKEVALQKVKEKVNQGFLIPKDIQDVTIDRVKGIYIPYQMADASYHAKQLFVNVESQGNYMKKNHFYNVEGKAHFKKITVDTSIQLNDESARRLEPYEMIDLKEFDPAYLSGFYADCSDEDRYITRKKLERRAGELYTEKVRERIRKKGGGAPDLESSRQECELENMAMVLMPAWFVVFHHEDESYTIMVNGQTGKVVGAVPLDRDKASTIFTVVSLVFSGLFASMLLVLCYMQRDNAANWLIAATFGSIFLWGIAHKRWRGYLHSQSLSKEEEIQKYSGKRVGDD